MTIEEKKERVIELRKAGATYEQISDALGYPKNSHGGGFVSKVLRECGLTNSRADKRKRLAVIDYVKAGISYEETAKLVGFSTGYVKLICYKNGIRQIQDSKEKRNEEMRAYKAQGHTMKEVAERFGVSQQIAQAACKGIAPQKSRPQEYKNGWDEERQIANAIRTIAERAPMFEYAGGYTGSDGFVDLRCKTCGAVIRKSYVSIRHGRVQCENCLRIAAEEKAKQEDIRRKIDADRKAWKEAGKRKAEQLSFVACECCGSPFFPANRSNTAYCSDECRRKAANTVSKDKRLRRISKVLVDKDIDLNDLFKRDNGVCAICGKRCRWDDSSTRDDGTFLAFGDYPSIDHIVPLSRGGKHAWNNVQLACRSCNSKKGNRVCPSLKKLK